MKLVSAILAIAIAIGCAQQASAETLNFPPSDFDVLNPAGTLIGHARYTLEHQGDVLTLHGESRYLDGQFDEELDHLRESTDSRELPRLIDSSHTFYNANGSLQEQSHADVASGLGTCLENRSGENRGKTEHFKFPPDTYAGASVLLPVQEFLLHPTGKPVLELHAYTCAGSPRLLAVTVKTEPRDSTWQYYPGKLLKIQVTADFGFWNFVLQPFVPKLGAWFDPAHDWLLVGAPLERYWRGPNIILVRTPRPPSSAISQAQKPSSMADPQPP